MKKYIVMLVVWAGICYLASPEQEETQESTNVVASTDSETAISVPTNTLAFDINFVEAK